MSSLPLHNLDERTRSYIVGRDAVLSEVLADLTNPQSNRIVIPIQGLGGLGKTALALEVGRRCIQGYAGLPPERRFDLIIWASAKRRWILPAEPAATAQPIETLASLLEAIERMLGPSGLSYQSIVETLGRVGRTLLILDNLEALNDRALIEWVSSLPRPQQQPLPVRVLITMRERTEAFGFPIRLTELADDDVREIIQRECAYSRLALSAHDVDQLVRASWGIPLAAKWALGLLKQRAASVAETLDALQSHDGEVLTYIFGRAMERVRQDPMAYDTLRGLSFFDRKTGASLDALADLTEMPPDELREGPLHALIELNLVQRSFPDKPVNTGELRWTHDRFTLLNATREYVRKELAHDSVGA